MAYDQLEHIPDAYWIGAQICQVMATVMGSGKRKYKVDDFIPRARPPRVISGEEGIARMKGLIVQQQARAKK